MNREQLPRIRLKVVTNGGINILCTALRTWTISDWLPHIQQAYRQVKEDQQDDEDSRKRFIKALRIKKGDFLIANSQLIGDIFQDNDEVQCEIQFPKSRLSTNSKKDQKKNKIQQKQILNSHNNDQPVQKNEPLKPNKKQKKQKVIFTNQIQQQQSKKSKLKSSNQSDKRQVIQNQPLNLKQKAVNKIKNNDKSKQKTQQKFNCNNNKQFLFKNVDLVKLKSILSQTNIKKKGQLIKDKIERKINISSQSDQQ